MNAIGDATCPTCHSADLFAVAMAFDDEQIVNFETGSLQFGWFDSNILHLIEPQVTAVHVRDAEIGHS